MKSVIVTTTVPVHGAFDRPLFGKNVKMRANEDQIYRCLIGGATVKEILPSGKTIDLSLKNYNKDNSGMDVVLVKPEPKPEPVVEQPKDKVDDQPNRKEDKKKQKWQQQQPKKEEVKVEAPVVETVEESKEEAPVVETVEAAEEVVEEAAEETVVE